MEKIIRKNIEVRLAMENEIVELQKFRYQQLLKNYRKELQDDGIDNDGYDKYCEHLIAYDNEKQKIVGTYRLATLETIKENSFITEQEFDISNIRATGDNILEIGRAVVHEDYRDGIVIQLLWVGMFNYILNHNIRFVLGMGSFHGVNANLYKHAFSYLYYNHRSPDELASFACNEPRENMNLLPLDEIDDMKVQEELTGLIRGYLKLGATVSNDIFYDVAFNSSDVLILLDMKRINKRFIERLMRIAS